VAPDQPRSFVFHDPSGTRWVRFRRVAQSAGLAVALLIAVFLLVGISLPQLPVLGLPAIAPVVQPEVADLSAGKHMPRTFRIAFRSRSNHYVMCVLARR
jgi:uncharacterized protein (DUF58 family)